ncbi:aminoglycoside phosphotransferase/kinase family protein [Streptomyces mayteni]
MPPDLTEPRELAAVAAAFDLGRPVGALRRLPNGGNPSVSGLLTTERGRFVVKTDRLTVAEWQLRRAERAHRLQSAALAAGVPMPGPVEPPAPAVGYWHRWGDADLVRVTEWQEGHELRSVPEGDADAAAWVGATLARIARLGLAGDDDAAKPLQTVPDWHSWAAEAEAGGLDVAGPARALLPAVEEATALILAAERDAPRRLLVHGDTSRANVLRTPAGYALIDWDAVSAEVPWWEAVSVAFRFATAYEGPVAQGDPAVVRPLLDAYLAGGGPGGPADVSAFAGMLRDQLGVTAWCLWLALGHRRADAEQRAFGARMVTAAERALPGTLRSLDRWTALLQ